MEDFERFEDLNTSASPEPAVNQLEENSPKITIGLGDVLLLIRQSGKEHEPMPVSGLLEILDSGRIQSKPLQEAIRSRRDIFLEVSATHGEVTAFNYALIFRNQGMQFQFLQLAPRYIQPRYSRRQMLGVTGASFIVGSFGTLLSRFLEDENPPDPIREADSVDNQEPSSQKEKPAESRTTSEGKEKIKENPNSSKGLELVLQHSLMITDPQNLTRRDNLLSPFEVSKKFLGNKFRYTGQDPDSKVYPSQQMHRFSLIGSDSMQLDENGSGIGREQITNLSHAINHLLDYSRLTDDQIKQWLVFTYQRSFGVVLIPEKLDLDRGKDGKVSNVTYKKPLSLKNRITVKVAHSITGLSPNTPGGASTAKEKHYPVIAENNRLVLPSGLSPNHDLVVPTSFLDLDKEFSISMANSQLCSEMKLTALDLAAAIEFFLEAQRKQAAPVIDTAKNGEKYLFNLAGPYIPFEDHHIKKLAENIAGINEDPLEQVYRITEFVQHLGYIWENDQDFNRHPLMTLFNRGSDCNNLTVLWSSLLAALKIDHAICYVPPEDGSTVAHILGGIPTAILNPTSPAVRIEKGHVLVELTNRIPIGQDTIPNQEVLFLEEFAYNRERKSWDTTIVL